MPRASGTGAGKAVQLGHDEGIAATRRDGEGVVESGAGAVGAGQNRLVDLRGKRTTGANGKKRTEKDMLRVDANTWDRKLAPKIAAGLPVFCNLGQRS